MVSIFKTLGEFITKHAWAIIIMWVLILLVSVPLALNFSNNLVYDTQKFIPSDLGANPGKGRVQCAVPRERYEPDPRGRTVR